MKILVTPGSMQEGCKSKALGRLSEFSDEIIYNPYGRPVAEEELIPLLKDCDGYIAGVDYVTENVISACNKLKVISRYGVGVDRVDLKAAKAKGIIVTNTPGANSTAVAELAMGLIFNLARSINVLDQKVRNGIWAHSNGIELSGKTMGILGLGAIGKNLARFAQGLSMKVMAYDPYMNEEYAKANNISSAAFDEVISNSDVISLHLPFNKDTEHIINKEVLNRMKKGTILVNTARGGLIDEAAAYQALKDGRLGGLGLDAFEKEPPEASPLFGLDNVVVTPHTGAHTLEASENMAEMSVDNLITVLSGKDCRYVVNR